MDRRGQVTIFIILAIVIVGGIIAYFSLRKGFGESIPVELQPVYDYYLNCLEDTSRQGIGLLGGQGGYIDVPKFEPGSAYMPFSSQLNFLGQPVPYWMYVSGNNILKEQVPTKRGMERALEEYVGGRADDCDFTDFELDGFDIYVDSGDAVVSVNELDIDLKVNSKMTIFKGEVSAIISSHDLKINSKLGKFYKLAKKVYNFEKADMFLEEYALDVMRLYAPVTGTEISCVPKVFVDEEIKEDIIQGLVTNIATLKIDGDYYDISSDERRYFVSDAGLNIDENMNFMYSADWPTKIEIYGERVAKPVGLQEGLGILGFCYVPYQLIYDINFPVMIQFYDDNELFQFPIGVIISKNQARKAMPTTTGVSIESEICKYNTQEVEVYTYDAGLNPVEAQISFKCLNSVCPIGESKISDGDAILKDLMPACVNGFIVAKADGYIDSKYMISTNEEGIANIIMDKKYEVGLDLGPEVKRALINFDSEKYSTTVLYPDMDSVELIEEYYNITVYVYDNSSLKFPAVNERKCVDVPESGIAGIFGVESEKCFDINLPEMDVSFAVVGGGKAVEYITSSQLEYSDELNIRVPLFGLPKNMNELSENNLAVEEEEVFLEFE